VPSGRRKAPPGAPRGVLADVLAAALRPGELMGVLTVLAPDHDPYRMDAPRKMEAGYWLRDRWAEMDALRGEETRHIRRIHYRLLSLEAVMPNGNRYVSNDECWDWLQVDAVKAARWLGLIPSDRIVDARNPRPVLADAEEPDPKAEIGLGIIAVDEDDFVPQVSLDGFTPYQPYHIVMVAEKSSTAQFLEPVAEALDTDLYTPAGEITDSFIWEIASAAMAGGRPLVVLTFDDGDPSGWQMAISIARKLQAFQQLWLPDLASIHRWAVAVVLISIVRLGAGLWRWVGVDDRLTSVSGCSCGFFVSRAGGERLVRR